MSAYEASDFLYASEKELTSANGAVNLLFKHKMSKFSTVTDCLIDLSTGDVVKNPLGTTIRTR